MNLLSVDPGKCTGYAVFDGGLLRRAGVASVPSNTPLPEKVRRIAGEFTGFYDEAAYELPQVYTRDKSKGDPNDLMPLAAIIGGFVMRFPETKHTLYKPREWKGQLTKDACHARITERLSEEEARTLIHSLSFVSATLRHNALDAVGIGLFHLGRLTKKRVYAR